MGGDQHAELEVGASLPVQGGSVVHFFYGVLAGGVEAGAEGVHVRLHEPGEGLEIYEFDGVGRRWIANYGLDAAAFLAVAVDEAGCEESGLLKGEAGRHLLLRK